MIIEENFSGSGEFRDSKRITSSSNVITKREDPFFLLYYNKLLQFSLVNFASFDHIKMIVDERKFRRITRTVVLKKELTSAVLSENGSYGSAEN